MIIFLDVRVFSGFAISDKNVEAIWNLDPDGKIIYLKKKCAKTSVYT